MTTLVKMWTFDPVRRYFFKQIPMLIIHHLCLNLGSNRTWYVPEVLLFCVTGLKSPPFVYRVIR